MRILYITQYKHSPILTNTVSPDVYISIKFQYTKLQNEPLALTTSLKNNKTFLLFRKFHKFNVPIGYYSFTKQHYFSHLW